MTPTRYRNVETKGDLVIAEICCTDGDTWAKFLGSEQMMKIQHAWETGGPELGEAILTLADGAERTRNFTADGWRTIVDSSEFAIYAMVQVAEEWWEAHNPGALWPWQLPEVQKA